MHSSVNPDPSITDTELLTVLSSYVLIHILEFLPLKELLIARVCRKLREAAKLTPVGVSEWTTDDRNELYISDYRDLCALDWLPDALPKLASLKFDFYRLSKVHRHVLEMTNPDEIKIIASFRHLRSLAFHCVHLTGGYPFLFNFPNLRSLCLHNVKLNWDLSMLQNMTRLERVACVYDKDNDNLTGDLSSISVLKGSLVELCLIRCSSIEGNLMDLANFSLLQRVDLEGSNKIVGDIRDIGKGLDDFQSIESLNLPESVWGGGDLPSIEETPAIMHAWYRLQKLRPGFFAQWRMSLPHGYNVRNGLAARRSHEIPTIAEFVVAARRKGWRWTNTGREGACETCWLDPAPDCPEEECYGVYLEDMKRIEKGVVRFKGLFVPPTVEEYLEMIGEYPRLQRRGSDDTWSL